MTAERTSPRTLVIAEGQLGDLLLLTPVFRAFKVNFPSADLSLLVAERRPSTSGLTGIIAKADNHFLRTVPHLSSVFVLRRDLLRSLGGVARLRAEWMIVRFLRAEGFDTIISAFPDDRFAVWAWLSGARVRIGEGRKGLSWAYTRSPVRRKGEGSILDYFCELAELAGCHVGSGKTEYVPPERDEEWATRFLEDAGLRAGRFILVHPGATGDYKIWPTERYRALIRTLVERSGYPVLICGGPREDGLVAEIRGLPPDSIGHIHVESEMGRFAALVKRAVLVISNDSGPRHVAVAVGTPSLALFRQFHDVEWGVYGESDVVRIVQSHEVCALCPSNSCEDLIPAGERYGSVCLRAIRDQEVVEVALSMLRRAPGNR